MAKITRHEMLNFHKARMALLHQKYKTIKKNIIYKANWKYL